MKQITLFLKVMIVYHVVSRSQAKVEVNCDENVNLSCSCHDSKDFLALTWYKMNGGESSVIIISGDDKEMHTFPRPATLGKGESLHLQKVTPQDSGTYKCIITVGLGYKNKECEVDLLVHACTTPTPNVLTTTVNSSKHAEDLPIMWSILGYLAVGSVKVLLSCITIMVIRACRIGSSRQVPQN
uniref:uncharacterized protein LOC131104757 n=1 Tax=Doryrhamphus excisus TaxID=161450 RepID=UPI0025ADDF9F|nr:uncharacterized protein LOC131104757 [Doryrhamphus excisus]